MNQRRIVRQLIPRQALSRAELAKAAGISQVTAGRIVDELIEQRILEVRGGRANGEATRLGRPGQLVGLDQERARFLAIQLGVTHTRLAVMPVAIRASDRWDAQIRTAGPGQRWVADVAQALGQLPRGIEAVLVSVPGVVDEASGDVLLCPNLRWAERVRIADLLRGLWGLPVLVVQEIRALALGHLAVEDGGDFLLVDFGDGVGGAAVVGGRLFESTTPLSGELGHTPVLGNSRRCGCGATGCVETLVSRRGLVESYGASDEATKRRSDAGERADAWLAMNEHIGRRGVERWLADGLDAAAVTIAGAMNVLGVRKVVLTGSLTELPACVVEYLAEAVRRGAMWARFGQVQCVAAPRRRLAGLTSAGIDRMLVPVEAGEPTPTGSRE